MIWFIADTHFGHESIIDLCGRPFKDAGDMETFMVKAWNERVRGDDTVFILGDMFFKHKDPERVLKLLKGKKRLIVGNHDGTWIGNPALAKYFIAVEPYAEFSDGKRKLVLFHYPLVTWNHEAKSYMIHGHIHNSTDSDYWSVIKNNPRILNAGADINGFCPVTFEQLQIGNERFKNGSLR